MLRNSNPRRNHSAMLSRNPTGTYASRRSILKPFNTPFDMFMTSSIVLVAMRLQSKRSRAGYDAATNFGRSIGAAAALRVAQCPATSGCGLVLRSIALAAQEEWHVTNKCARCPNPTSSRHLLPGSMVRLALALADGWIPGTSPGMTSLAGRKLGDTCWGCIGASGGKSRKHLAGMLGAGLR